MGPQCPHCGAIYEWTCGELEEQVTAPKVYFCQECRGLFILAPEEVEALQERFRPALEEATAPEPIDDPVDEPDEVEAPQQVQAPHQVQQQVGSQVDDEEDGELHLRERVVVITGPHQGTVGAVAVIDGDRVMLRIEGSNHVVRVDSDQVQRAA
jgi:predicted  nucleic acid-binding Zn-ribbon protein